MNKPLLHVLFPLLVCLTLPLAAAAQVVDIPDSNLRAKIEEALGKASGATITAADMAGLTHLTARGANITNLTGLEFAANLTNLDLSYGGGRETSHAVKDLSPLADLTQLTQLRLPGNSISDISAVADLTNLTWLNLWGNPISDISPVGGLTNLTNLYLGGNNITDISPLSGLTSLTGLWLNGNNITDISPLSGLTNLKGLWLNGNNITDILPLAGLTNLMRVGLRHNYISDISPLVANTGLGSGDEVLLNDNPLSYSAIKTHVPALQNRGVTVEFGDTTHLNVGEPRTVRMIYFLPNDRPYRTEMVQNMKDQILKVQTFYAEQMDAHGYGRRTFRVETDPQGEPMVHRVDGQQPNNSNYQSGAHGGDCLSEIEQVGFDITANVYLIAMDLSNDEGGAASRWGKNGGAAILLGNVRFTVAAHELGHAFGLWHDFRDGSYLMSDGPGSYDQLSACHAEYLAVHPYFNPHIPIEEGPPPSIELISSQYIYPAGSKSVPIQFRISDSDELHQWFLHAWQPHLRASVKVCGGVRGTQEIIINFDYDGVIPSAHDPSYSRNTSLLNPLVHPIRIEAVDVNGNVGRIEFELFSEAFQPLSKILGDNQRGVPNTPLASPFVVELRNSDNGWTEPGVPVTFTVTAGGGTLNVTRTTTDTRSWKMGRAESTLTLGPNLGTNTVEVSAGGFTVTFNAVAGAPVDIPDANLRAAIEEAHGKAPGTPIAPSEMTTLTRFEARNANITDLTGLEGAIHLKALDLGGEQVGNRFVNNNSVSNLSPLTGLTQLEDLDLWGNSVSDISALAELTNLTGSSLIGNSITDLSALAGLTNLEALLIDDNPISDISPLAGLTNLTKLGLNNISVSDLSPLAGLTNLKWMRLAWNNISDLSPLVANTGLESGDEINLKGNPLSYQSIHTHIPTLQSRGVTVEFDNQAHPALLKISGDNQNGASLTPLFQPFVIEAQDANGSALAGISVRFAVTTGDGTLSTTITRTDTNGRAQSTLTLGPSLGTNTVEVSATGVQGKAIFHAISDTESPPISADVNGDGSVNVLDLIVITANLDNRGSNLAADVNRDGVVNILDLVLAAGMFDGAAAAPSAQPQVPETLTAVEVQGWLTDARSLEIRDPIMKRGFLVLEQLLVSLTPKATELLANYPNPFNPETWIPYRLAEDAFVTLTIYDLSGQAVRTLGIGHRIAAVYEGRSQAIHWDGRNDVGEQVASGVYFYTLIAGDYSATRRMVILK